MLTFLKPEDMKINLFNEDSCIINVSLLNPIGRVRRVTPNITNLFGITRN